uniref:Protein BUD31 homolog n=1 Tax=Callinectes arcuatus TaxID=257891 RepID=A0A7T1L7F0_CALAT|nr:maternal g10 protein [Callinectes arcuatus]
MPKIRTLRTRAPPAGFGEIEPILEELAQKMKEAVNEDHEGKRRAEANWPIMRIHHQQSRYIFELYHKKKLISKELYNWLVTEKYADQALIAKWRKNGYERLCCLKCVQQKDHNHGSVCICRVPRADLPKGKVIECQACGCRGCASGDGGYIYMQDYDETEAAVSAKINERRAQARARARDNQDNKDNPVIPDSDSDGETGADRWDKGDVGSGKPAKKKRKKTTTATGASGSAAAAVEDSDSDSDSDSSDAGFLNFHDV